MIAKRAQYGRGKRRPCKKIKTVAGLNSVLEYFTNQEHEDHIGHVLDAVKFSNASAETFTDLTEALAETYRKRPATRGRKWQQEIAEHLIFSPPTGANLSEAEKIRIESRLVERVALGVPSVTCWHTGPDGRQHLHAAFGNVLPGQIPRLRVTELRQGGVKDYAAVLRSIAKEIIEELNKDRALGREIETLETVKEKKVGQILLAVVEMTKWSDNEDDILAILERAGWKIRRTKKTLSLARPGDKKPTRFNPHHFREWLADLHQEKAQQKRLDRLRPREPGHDDV